MPSTGGHALCTDVLISVISSTSDKCLDRLYVIMAYKDYMWFYTDTLQHTLHMLSIVCNTNLIFIFILPCIYINI